MTGPSGNRLSAPWSIEALGEAILNLSGQIDLPITLETSHYLFIINWLCLLLPFMDIHAYAL